MKQATKVQIDTLRAYAHKHQMPSVRKAIEVVLDELEWLRLTIVDMQSRIEERDEKYSTWRKKQQVPLVPKKAE